MFPSLLVVCTRRPWRGCFFPFLSSAASRLLSFASFHPLSSVTLTFSVPTSSLCSCRPRVLLVLVFLAPLSRGVFSCQCFLSSGSFRHLSIFRQLSLISSASDRFIRPSLCSVFPLPSIYLRRFFVAPLCPALVSCLGLSLGLAFFVLSCFPLSLLFPPIPRGVWFGVLPAYSGGYFGRSCFFFNSPFAASILSLPSACWGACLSLHFGKSLLLQPLVPSSFSLLCGRSLFSLLVWARFLGYARLPAPRCPVVLSSDGLPVWCIVSFSWAWAAPMFFVLAPSPANLTLRQPFFWVVPPRFWGLWGSLFSSVPRPCCFSSGFFRLCWSVTVCLSLRLVLSDTSLRSFISRLSLLMLLCCFPRGCCWVPRGWAGFFFRSFWLP